MRDDAAKTIVWLVGICIAVGLVVLGAYVLITGDAYSPDYCLRSNVEAGFYPFNPPRKSVDEPF